jgi:broad specificity phosphatase PhoE
MSLRLFVVRHGETDWSRERRFAGWRDVPLSEAGRRQCEAVAQALASTRVTAVSGSPLERARLSAEIIAKPHHLAVEVEPDFREMGFGQWEGLTRGEVAARFPREWEVWSAAPERFAAPAGEALPAVAERVARGLGRLRGAHEGGSVILVTHAIVARLIVLAALGLEPARLWTVDAAPAGISELEYRDDWVTVHRMNTLGHLDGAGGMA